MEIRQYYERRAAFTRREQWQRLIAGSIGASAAFLILSTPATVSGCIVAVAKGVVLAAFVLTLDVIIWAQLNKARRRRGEE
jgi:hypothetical protein